MELSPQSKAFWKYQRRALMSAWEETWKWSPVNEKQAVFTLIALIATWVTAISFGVQEELANSFGIVTVVVPCTVWIAFFLSQRCMAASRMLQEIEADQDQLREKLVPKLRLEFLGQQDTRYYRMIDQYKCKILVSVHNDSDISISDIDVTCDEVVALTMDAAIVPLCVDSERKTFNLHAQQHEFRTIFLYRLDDTDRPGQIEVLARSPIRTDEFIKSSRFRLKIAARGKETTANPIWIDCWVIDRTVHAKREL